MYLKTLPQKQKPARQSAGFCYINSEITAFLRDILIYFDFRSSLRFETW